MLSERVLIGEVLLSVVFQSESSYTLRYGDLVEYSNRRRRVGARVYAYQFRSVEQLRYDFEEDVRRAGGSL